MCGRPSLTQFHFRAPRDAATELQLGVVRRDACEYAAVGAGRVLAGSRRFSLAGIGSAGCWRLPAVARPTFSAPPPGLERAAEPGSALSPLIGVPSAECSADGGSVRVDVLVDGVCWLLGFAQSVRL